MGHVLASFCLDSARVGIIISSDSEARKFGDLFVHHII